MRFLLFFALGLAGFAGAGAAQTPAEMLVGRWVAQTNFCKQSIIVVTAVDPNGIVRGTFTCASTNWSPVMGEAIDKNAVRATLSGTRFKMENADGGGWDLAVTATKLDGLGSARRAAGANPLTYVKE